MTAKPSTVVAVTCRVEYVHTRLAMMADLVVVSSWVISAMYRTSISVNMMHVPPCLPLQTCFQQIC